MNEITRSYSEENTVFGYLITLIVSMQIISSNYKQVFVMKVDTLQRVLNTQVSSLLRPGCGHTKYP